MATKQQPGPAFLSRIANDEYIGNVDVSNSISQSMDDNDELTLPWDVEGIDHADEGEDASHGPQHEMQEEQCVTPHGTTTSILSAAGYDSSNEEQQGENFKSEQQEMLDKKNRHQARQQQNQHQKSLRLRAAKYFRGTGNTSASESNANAQKSEPVNNDTKNCDGNNSHPDDLQHETPENGPITTSNQFHHVQYQINPTAAISSKICHISKQTPLPPQNHTTNYKPSRLPNPAKRYSLQNKTSLTFFPRTRVTSPSNISTSSQSGKSSPTFSDSSKHTDTKTEVTTAMNSISNTVVSRYSDPPLSMSAFSRYSDPSLQYPDDAQSQATSLATSVTYGSDLENAARRILGRKRSFLRSSSGASIGGYSSGGEERQVIGDTAILGSQPGIDGGKVQRRPSRERMMKVTGRSIGLPTRDDTGDETEKESIDDVEGEKMDVLYPLPPSRGYSSDYAEETDDNQFEEEDENQYTRKIASMLGTSTQNHHGNLLNNSDEEEDASKQFDQTGAFPTFTRPGSPDEVDTTGELSAPDNPIDDFEEKWGLVPTTSWVDPNKAFLAADQGDYGNFYDREEIDVPASYQDPNNHDEGFDAIYDMANSHPDTWDDGWYQQRQSQRATCSSSLEGDAGEAESENDGGDFNHDDYFHDFGSNWEELPAPVQFSPSRGAARSNASNHDIYNLHHDHIFPEQDDEYVTRSSEIDFFAWHEDENPGVGDIDNLSNIFPGRASPNLQQQFNTDDPNISMDVLSDTDAERRSLLHRKVRKEIKTNRLLPAEYPFSDGDTSTRKAKRGLNLFRSRSQLDGSFNYHSEGERSDSDLESTPVRPKRWSNMQKMSPRSFNFFGERRHDKKKTQIENDSVLVTQHEMFKRISEISNMSVEAAQSESNRVSPTPKQLNTTIDSSQRVYVQPKMRQVTPELGQMKANMNCSPARVHSNAGKDRSDKSTITGPPLHTSNSSKHVASSGNALIHPSARSNTPASTLNDSLLTQETPLVSNKALANELPPAPSFTQSNSSLPGVSDDLNKKSSPPRSGLPPRLSDSQLAEKRGSPVAARKKKPQSPGFTGADILISKEEDDECSTLQSESLGSLVTKPTSLRSGMSEIERLRKENERLREELENRSMSSKVSSTYVRTLQEQNELLRQAIKNGHNGTHNSSDMMYKSTIATLLERDDPLRRTRPRRKNSSKSPRKTRAENHQQHSTRKPAAPLINGADFDDESITTYTYSESIRGKKVHFTRDDKSDVRGGPGILQTIATTTRMAADQVKTVAQEKSIPARGKKTCEISFSRPLELIAACTRKDRGNNTGTVNCAPKEVIGRALGCIKQNKYGDKQVDPAGREADSSTASDSLVDRRADTKSPRVPGESLSAQGFVGQ